IDAQASRRAANVDGVAAHTGVDAGARQTKVKAVRQRRVVDPHGVAAAAALNVQGTKTRGSVSDWSHRLVARSVGAHELPGVHDVDIRLTAQRVGDQDVDSILPLQGN